MYRFIEQTNAQPEPDGQKSEDLAPDSCANCGRYPIYVGNGSRYRIYNDCRETIAILSFCCGTCKSIYIQNERNNI